MYYFKHADEDSMLFDELSEYTDTLCIPEADEDLQAPADSEGMEEINNWITGDEAAFWMSL